MRLIVLLTLTAVALANPAVAQAWREYAYPKAGFAVHLPGEPTVESGSYTAPDGISVKATIYRLRRPNLALSMTVVDLTNTASDNCNVIEQTVRRVRETGEILTDVTTEIDDQYGRELSITEKDGSRSIFAIFYMNHRLYELKGHVLPPQVQRRAADAIRFQQSLSFIGQPLGCDG